MLNRIITSLILLTGMHLTAQERPDAAPPGTVWTDTVNLQDVTISVLPFQATADHATGGVFAVNTLTVPGMFAIGPTDLINLVPGIHMASGTYNTNRLVIRGVGSRTPYNTNRIRAYLDEIPLTSGDGISTVEDLDLSGIGTMEVLKGPSSALYGSGLGGIIRFNPSYPGEAGLSASITGEWGSFRSGRLGTSLSFKGNKMAVSGSLFRSFSAGYRENSSYSRSNAFLNLRYFGERNNFSFTFSAVDLFAGIPSSLNETDFHDQPQKAADNWLAVEGHERYFRLLGGIKMETGISRRARNHMVLFSTYSDPYESRPFNILDDRNAALGLRDYLEYERLSVSFVAGLEYYHEWYGWQIYETESGTRGELVSDHSEVRRYANGFATFQWRASDRFRVDAGANLNLLEYSLKTVFTLDSTDHTGRYSYDPVLSPRIGISFQHHSQHFFYASAGHGFSAPSLEETLLPEGSINTMLKPESGWNLEAGHRGRLLENHLWYDATLYAIFLNNLLVTERISESVFTGANAGRAMNAGFELWAVFTLRPEDQLRIRAGDDKGSGGDPINARLSLSCAISGNRFLDFVDDGMDYSGNTLPGIPAQKLTAMLTGIGGSAELDLRYEYTGRQWITDANDRRYGAYHLLHLQISRIISLPALPVTLELRGGIRNILNIRYASMILVNAPAFGGSLPRYYYPGLPRQFHIGFSLRFNNSDRFS